jgi:hypothetical protein
MFNKKTGKKDIPQAKPKESKPLFSPLAKAVMIPGAIITGLLILIATGFGIFKIFNFSKKKKVKTKQTSLDK